MIGIIFATLMEANPFLKKTCAQKVETRLFTIYMADMSENGGKIIICICGMGKVAAALATQKLICNYKIKAVINAGICGSLIAECKTKELFLISSALEGDLKEFGKLSAPYLCDNKFFTGMKKASLVTCDAPVFDSAIKKNFAKLADLVDMEGASVARTALMYGMPCMLVKGVTDIANSKSRVELKQNLNEVSEKIAQTLINYLF